MSIESSSVSITVTPKPVVEYYYNEIVVSPTTGIVGTTFTINGIFYISIDGVVQSQAGKKVELLIDGVVSSTATTDSTGSYTFKITPTVAKTYVIKTRAYK